MDSNVMSKCSVCQSQVVPPFVFYCVTCWNRLNRRYKITVDEFREYITISYQILLPYWCTPFVTDVYWYLQFVPQCVNMPALIVLLEKRMFLKVAGFGFCGSVDEYERRRGVSGVRRNHRAGIKLRLSRIRRTERLNGNTHSKSMSSISRPNYWA